MRLENERTISATIGISTSATSVSCQFRYSSQPSSPRMMKLSRTTMMTTAPSVAVTLLTSDTSREISWPADSRAKKPAGSSAIRANMSRRRSVSTRWATHDIA